MKDSKHTINSNTENRDGERNIYCYENGNGVLKIINNSSKNNKTFSYKCIHPNADPCHIKGKTEQTTVITVRTQSIMCEDDTWDSVRIWSALCKDT